MARLAFIIAALLPLELHADICDRQTVPLASIVEHVGHLSKTIGPRSYGSPQSAKAEEYLRDELVRRGLSPQPRKPIGRHQVPQVSVFGYTVVNSHIKDVSDSNVVVTMGSGDETRLFMAHYDSVFDSPGAVDNAVSVAILLELAARLQSADLRHRVTLAFTAAEESGLIGARDLAQRGSLPTMAVSLDLLGLGGPVAFNGLGEQMTLSRLRWLHLMTQKANVETQWPIPHRVLSRLVPQIERSDHREFTLRGVPSFHLFNRFPYAAYHSKWDTMDQVDLHSVRDAWLLACQLASSPKPFPNGEEEGGAAWVSFGGHVFFFAKAWLWLIELLLLLTASIFILLGFVRPRRPRESVAYFGYVLLAWLGTFGLIVGAWALSSELYAHSSPWVHHVHVAMVGIVFCLLAGIGMTVSLIRIPKGLQWLSLATGLLQGSIVTALWALQAPELALPMIITLLAASILFYFDRMWLWLLLIIPALLVPFWLLHGDWVREIYFHRMSPVPIPVYAALISLPYVAVVFAWAARMVAYFRVRRSKAHWLLIVACAAVGIALLLMFGPLCTGHSFVDLGFACECQGQP